MIEFRDTLWLGLVLVVVEIVAAVAVARTSVVLSDILFATALTRDLSMQAAIAAWRSR